MYVCIYVCVCVRVYIYLYICIHFPCCFLPGIDGGERTIFEGLPTDLSLLLHFCCYTQTTGKYILLMGHCWGMRKRKEIHAALSWQIAKLVKESEGEQELKLVCLN